MATELADIKASAAYNIRPDSDILEIAYMVYDGGWADGEALCCQLELYTYVTMAPQYQVASAIEFGAVRESDGASRLNALIGNNPIGDEFLNLQAVTQGQGGRRLEGQAGGIAHGEDGKHDDAGS